MPRIGEVDVVVYDRVVSELILDRMPTGIVFFFFHAEDGIRVLVVTGVQTCALPICGRPVDRDPSLNGGNASRASSHAHSNQAHCISCNGFSNHAAKGRF